MYIVLKTFALFFKELHFNWTYFFALPYEFYTVFSYEFLCVYMNFLLLISIRIFCVFSPLILCLFRPYFTTNFLLLLQQIRLPRLFCFYNLTKRSSYSFLHAVPLKQCFWLYYLYIRIFWCKTHLTMSLIVFSFSRLVLSLKTVLLLPPTTVLCIFFKC